MYGQPKRLTSYFMHPMLHDRLVDRAAIEERSQAAVLEQALAEYLHVPPALDRIPQQALELCPRCMQRVLYGKRGKCPGCKWDRSKLHGTRVGWRTP